MSKAWLWTAAGLMMIAGGSYSLYAFLQPRPLPEQVLYGNGHVEGTEVRVASEIAGRVTESRLAEGTTVDKGSLLVRIDDVDLLLKKEQVEAEIETIQRMRERADREYQVARHHLATAQRDVTRYRELGEHDTVSSQRVEQAEDAFQEARGRVGVAEAEVSVIDGRMQSARKELRLVENQLARTRIVAPVQATVLAKAVEAGEFVTPGQPVAVLADLRELELNIFIPERDIGKVRLDAPVRVKVDAFPDRMFDGRVARVDQQAQFTPRDIHMPQERTRMVFGVTVALDNPDRVLKPGMPADAWLLWRPDASWPEQLFVPG